MAEYLLQPLLNFITPIHLPIPLLKQKGYACGIDKTNEITLPHRMVSIKHCIFLVNPNGLRIFDLKSEFGTYINGKKIEPYTWNDIAVNDIIGISNDKTYDVEYDKPYVYRVEIHGFIKQEIGRKRKSDEFPEMLNKLVKIESNNNSEIIDLIDEANICTTQENPQQEVVMDNRDEEATADTVKMDCGTIKAEEEEEKKEEEEEEETDVDEEAKVPLNSVDAIGSQIIEPPSKDKSTTDKGSSVVRSYPFRKMIVYSARCVKNIQENRKNKNTLKNEDQENVPPVSNDKVGTSEESTLNKTDALESTVSTSFKSTAIEKQSSVPIAATSSINKQISNDKQCKNFPKDLRNYLISKNEEKKKNQENKSFISSSQHSCHLESNSDVKKQTSNLLDANVKKFEYEKIEEDSKNESAFKNKDDEPKHEKKKFISKDGQEKKLEISNNLRHSNQKSIGLQNKKDDDNNQQRVICNNKSAEESIAGNSGSNIDDTNERIEPPNVINADFIHTSLSEASSSANLQPSNSSSILGNKLYEVEKVKSTSRNPDSSSMTKRRISIVHNQEIQIPETKTLNATEEEINSSCGTASKLENSINCNQKCMAEVVAETSKDCSTDMPEPQQSYNPSDVDKIIEDDDCSDFLDIDLESDIGTNLFQGDSNSTHETAIKHFDSNVQETNIPYNIQSNIEETPVPPTLKDLDYYAQSINEYNTITHASGLPIGFLLSFLKWNPIWENTYEKKSFTHREFGTHESISYAPSYANFETYYSDMTELILLELWSFINKKIGNKKGESRHVRASIHKNSIFQTPKDSKNNALTELEIEIDNNVHLVVGDLVILKLKFSSQSINIFAYVKSIRTIRINYTTRYDRVLKSTVFLEPKQPLYTLITKSLPSNINCKQSHELIQVYNISSFIRMAQGIECLKSSPLQPIIAPLSNKMDLLKSNMPNNYKTQDHLVTGDELDDKQKEAILRITNAIMEGSPKVVQINGPPGSGKSRIIVNIVAEIMNNYNKDNKKRKRILVCAPSNEAVDEITMRLIKIHDKLEAEYIYTPFKMVRVGRFHSRSSDIKDITLFELAKAMDKREVLIEADVIMCTLTSCYSYGMELAFGKGLEKISACIIDNATTCCEPESLIPLKLGVEQFVLVGDSKELPTSFFSEVVKTNRNHVSLFSRLYEMFQFHDVENPIIELTAQYRTSEEIFSWVNKYFYQGNIQTKVSLPSTWPFCNFKVFDHNSDEDDSYYREEANYVIDLIETIINRMDSIRIGVFTYHLEQRNQIDRLWKHRLHGCDYVRHKDRRELSVEISTTDRIQKREFDVIIMCCGRKKKPGFLTDEQLLYFLFTYVKYSLFICGDFESFKPDGIWKNSLQYAHKNNLYELVDYKKAAEDIEKIPSRIFNKRSSFN